VGCYIWYSKEGSGRGRSPPTPLLAVPNVTAHPSTAIVPITVLLYNGPLLYALNVPIKGLKKRLDLRFADSTEQPASIFVATYMVVHAYYKTYLQNHAHTDRHTDTFKTIPGACSTAHRSNRSGHWDGLMLDRSAVGQLSCLSSRTK